ncbi:MAG: hypothetical protein ACRCSB_04585 [Bacteroidales bacterium]
MKKIKLFIAFLILTTYTLSAQEKAFAYCELLGTGKLFSKKVNVQADFGQQTSFWKGTDYLKDSEGRKLTFNSMVDAMNFMGTEGWEFVQAYVVTVGSQNVYHWLLKKEISEEQNNELKDGFKGE